MRVLHHSKCGTASARPPIAATPLIAPLNAISMLRAASGVSSGSAVIRKSAACDRLRIHIEAIRAALAWAQTSRLSFRSSVRRDKVSVDVQLSSNQPEFE